MFQSGCMADKKRISAPGRSGKSKRSSRSSWARAASADHVAQVLFGEIVVGEVDGLEAGALEGACQLGGLALLDRQADEDVGLAGVGDAVVELGDAAVADQLAKALEAATRFRDGDGEQRLRCSPISARSATKRSRSKFMLCRR